MNTNTMPLVVVLVLGLLLGAVESRDFVEETDGFQFVYHEVHNLLLTIHNGSCYFVYIAEHLHSQMNNGQVKSSVENDIIHKIQNQDKIYPSTLETMRDEYADLLANFRCLDKNIYTLSVMSSASENTTGIFHCDFGDPTDPYCGFTRDPAVVKNWVVHSGDTTTQGTGPHKDHTCGNDDECLPAGYVYMNASAMNDGAKALLVSQTFNANQLPHHCLRFYYHMQGNGMGSLSIYIVSPGSLAQLTAPVWHMSGNQGDQWHNAEVPIDFENDFQIVFEGRKSSLEHSHHGDIALDDIALFANTCSMHPASGQVRLVGGSSVSEGRLEVYIEGRWGTVCPNHFDERSAAVVCNMLGYTGTQPVVEHHSFYGESFGPTVLTDVRCLGNETNILDCHYLMRTCSHENTIGLVCQPINQTSGQVRLVGGIGPHEGRVEVLINGRWGTVCSHSFDVKEATVVCRMLGYSGSQPTVEIDAFYGQGSGHVWMNKLDCDGTESTLLDCHPEVNDHIQCDHDLDVGVNCLPSAKVRLVNGSTPYEGRVEVFVDGRWGTVCANRFHENEAKVICRMMGLDSDHPTAMARSVFGIGSEPVLLEKVECLGNETSILECKHSVVAQIRCQLSNEVGVICNSPV